MQEFNKYLPPIISEYSEMKEIYKAEAPEFSTYENKVDLSRYNLFIDTSDEAHIYEIEKMLDIVPIENLTLAERKQRIKMYQKYLPRYTFDEVIHDLFYNSISGTVAYAFFNFAYYLIISCDVPIKMWTLYYKRLTEIIPCNIRLEATNTISKENKGTLYYGGATSINITRRVGF